jgi:hypothetical protein
MSEKTKERKMKNVTKLMLSIFMTASLSGVNAWATATEVDNGENAPIFKVDGKTVSASKAIEEYTAGKLVEKCTPIRNAVDSTGKSLIGYKCKAQKRVTNGRTGNTTWKSL